MYAPTTEEIEARFEPDGAPPILTQRGQWVMLAFRICVTCGALVHPDRGLQHHVFHLEVPDGRA